MVANPDIYDVRDPTGTHVGTLLYISGNRCIFTSADGYPSVGGIASIGRLLFVSYGDYSVSPWKGREPKKRTGYSRPK